MSEHPETDALTAGCSFGPFVEALAEKCRELEVQRDMLVSLLWPMVDCGRHMLREDGKLFIHTSREWIDAARKALQAAAAKREVKG